MEKGRPTINLDEIYQTSQNSVDVKHELAKPQIREPTRTQFLKGYGRKDMKTTETNLSHASDHHQIRQNIRLRLKYFCHHVRWICRNIVNLEAIESRKDLVTFSVKSVKNLKTHATSLLKVVDSERSERNEQTMRGIPDILKLLHALESVVAREYVAPMLSVNYLKHIQGMGASLMKPHWSMDCVCESEPDQYRAKIQELSQHIIPIYFNLMTLLHLLDIDLHNSLFYQCSGLLQKYHMVASGRGGYGDEKEKSFYDQHVPFLNEVLALFELVEEMVHDSSSNLMIPSSTASLWVHEIRLVLDMFELYKSDL